MAGHSGEDECGGGAEVGGHDGCADEFLLALDDDGVAFFMEAGAEAGEFGDVEEAVGEDFFGDDAVAVGDGEEGHELGLQVGGETGVGLRGERRGF